MSTTITTSKPLLLYTHGTPNGNKLNIACEELKSLYHDQNGFEYEARKVDIMKGEQKEKWFVEGVNPNGRIPALIDPNRNNFAVFESSAILLYLAQHYDPSHHLSFSPTSDADHYSEMIQWMLWVHGGIGPMQGQAHYFYRHAEEKIPHAIQRYQDETKRLYTVLNARLESREYLVGPGKGKYSFADVGAYPWVMLHRWAGVKDEDVGPHVQAWLKRIGEREAVKKGVFEVPEHNFFLEHILATPA